MKKLRIVSLSVLAFLFPTAIFALSINSGLEQKVRTYFANDPIMAEIARCESSFRQFDASGKPLDGGSGSMIGLFQIHSTVHESAAKSMGLNIYTVEGNMAYAKYLYKKEGTDPWLDSKSCWQPNSVQASKQKAPTKAKTLAKGLSFGVVSNDVRTVQEILNAKGYTVADDGPGSPGEESEIFGARTRRAVQKFQCDALGLCSGSERVNGYGRVGEKTLAALTGPTPDEV